MTKGAVLVISGPSGCGKSTLKDALMQNVKNVYFSISTTTRPARQGEVEGVHYHFVSKEQFLADIDNNVFLEWATVHKYLYGTSLLPIERALEEDKIVLFDVDVQGHKSIKAHFGDFAKSIFITTPSPHTLRARLEARQTDSPQMIETRLKQAYIEMEHIKYFDYLIINDDLEEAKAAIIAIARSLKYQQKHRFKAYIQHWRN